MRDFGFWLALALATAPVWGAVLWEAWEGVVRPRLIPQDEIDAMARRFIAQYGSSAGAAALREWDRARRRTETFEAAKWRRVHAALNDR